MGYWKTISLFDSKRTIFTCRQRLFIWDSFREDVNRADLVAQEPEGSGIESYHEMAQKIEKHFSYIPNELSEYLKKLNNTTDTEEIIAYNAGVMGGCNTKFFKKYCNLVFDIIKNNIHEIEKIGDGGINIILEQGLFWQLSENEGIKPKTLFDKIRTEENFLEIIEFGNIPHSKFLHTIGNTKENAFIREQVSLRLLMADPQLHEKIVSM